MNTTFMKSENSKTSNPHWLLLNFGDKLNLSKSNKYVALSNLSICYAWKNVNKLYKNNKFNISSNTEWIVWITWWIIFCIRYSKLIEIYLETITEYPSIMIYINKIENRITFEIDTSYYLKLLTPETMKLLEN